MSDRVLVVRDGRIDCELKGEQINEQEIIKRALGEIKMADKKTSLSPAKNIFKDQRVLLAIVIALIVVIISCINPNFIGINNIVAIFQQICVLGILTMAMSILLIPAVLTCPSAILWSSAVLLCT